MRRQILVGSVDKPIRRSIKWSSAVLAIALMIVLGPTAARAQSLDCIHDVQGPDDEPGQKDLNQFCDALGDNAPYELTVNWNLDDTAWSGSNTGDACVLFDTDGDHNANFALCVTVLNGPPAVIKPGTPKLYSCTDTRPDRCVGYVAITSFASTCSVGQGTDPFTRSTNACKNTPGCRTTDTVVTCRLESGDLPGTESCVSNRCSNIPSQFCLGDGDCIPITDACSYPSEQPNSNPSDCVITPTGQDPCQGVSCAAFDTQCATASCNPQNGQCELFTPKPSTTACTGASNGGACDAADHCSGTANTCVDGFQSVATICRASAGQCDVAETCTGTSGACPADAFQSGTTSCTGTSNGDVCDAADHCSGSSNSCIDAFQGSTFTCRASAGQCDVAETCTGTSATCPADGFQPSTASCTGTSNGATCDAADHCSGSSNTCIDVFKASTFTCRASAGQCDVAETCTGASGACPADVFQPSTAGCTGTSSDGACDGADHCSGSNNTCVDGFKASTFTCRASAGQCDVAESCTGTAGTCPADGFQPNTASCTGTSSGGACDGADHCSGTANTCVDGFQSVAAICRASAGQCDVAETCTGTSGACPADGFRPNTASCTGTSNGGACDGADHCSGSSNTCVDVFQASTFTCRVSAGQCDVAESCTGTSGTCPANGFQSSTASCTGTSSGGACDGADHCSGTANSCVDVFQASTFTCRASAGQCDVAESCTGTSGTCPANGFQSSTAICAGTSTGGACDGADHCSGTANSCVDVFQASTSTCRASAGQCDVAETCTGASGICPADGFRPNTASCAGTSNGGACDGADHCSGTANSCVDVFQASTFTCRASAGQCDVAETCTGTSGICPADGFRPNTASCAGTSNGGACDGADHCTGWSNTCIDVFQTPTFTCRESAGQCDVAELCTGKSGTCPADGFQPSTMDCKGTSYDGECDGEDHCSGSSDKCIDVFQASTFTCRESTGQCDVAETCTGTSGACPGDDFQPNTAGCTGPSNGGACDAADHCSGSSDTCIDVFQASTFTCRASAGQCDVAETCTGTSGTCPADSFQPSTASCMGTSNGGGCDGADHCSGSSTTCIDVFQTPTFTCRESTGQCDVAETCTGTSGTCPADSFQPSTASCMGTSNGGGCDGADHCSGSSTTCIDVFQASTFTCRASAGQCDVAETCTGTSGTCPADSFQPSTASCMGTSNGGACDGADHCSGSSTTCIDVFQGSTFTCRASAGQCDVAETCAGTSGACPADAFQSSTASCTGPSTGGACDGADHCSGSGNSCIDGFQASTVTCRVSTDQCDPAERCTGTSGACPADAFGANGTACNDLDACTTADTCASGRCVGGLPPNCDDANVCTVDVCDTVIGCTHTNEPDGTDCSDQNACTLQDVCLNGECVSGNGPTSDPGCVLDTVGADDVSGQKDLTGFCQNVGATCSGTILTWQWDDVAWSGNNTGDACALYDTDSDGFANYALCVTVGGTPAGQLSSSPRLYLCTDGKAFNCTGSTLVPGRQSSCVVNTLVTDPFAASNRSANQCGGTSCLSRDTQTQCCVRPSDFAGPAELIDVCSYPSQSPSSNPSECVKTVFCTNDNACVVQNGEGSCQGRCLSVDGVTQCVYTP